MSVSPSRNRRFSASLRAAVSEPVLSAGPPPRLPGGEALPECADERHFVVRGQVLPDNLEQFFGEFRAGRVILVLDIAKDFRARVHGNRHGEPALRMWIHGGARYRAPFISRQCLGDLARGEGRRSPAGGTPCAGRRPRGFRGGSHTQTLPVQGPGTVRV